MRSRLLLSFAGEGKVSFILLSSRAGSEKCTDKDRLTRAKYIDLFDISFMGASVRKCRPEETDLCTLKLGLMSNE